MAPSPEPQQRRRRAALAVLSAVVLALAPLAIALHMFSARGITHTVGVFVVLAELLRDGVLYPHSPTQDLVYSAFYHPLAFAPLALLPGRGLAMLPGLRLLVGVELCSCLVLCGVLARRAGLRGLATWQPVAWALCTVPVGFGLLGMRDDPRATLLALLAVVLHPLRRGGTELAAIALVAAFFTKATAPFAPALALAFVSWRRGGGQEIARFIAAGALTAAASIAYLQWGANADFLGNGLYYALLHPAKAPRTWEQTFAVLLRDLTWDRTLPLLLGASMLTTAIAVVRRRAGVLELLVLAAWLKSVLAYRSIGTELNHLLDLTLYSCVQLAARWRAAYTPARALAMLALFAFGSIPRPFTTLLPLDDAPPLAQCHVATKAAVLRGYLQQKPMRVLCEEPLLAWEAGTVPLVTDPLLTFGTLERWPEIRAAWFGPSDAQGAVQMLVLMRNPFAPEHHAEAWYGPIHFDAAFLADVRKRWQVVLFDDQTTVLVRKP